MQLLGNDIVDLSDASTFEKYRDSRFLSRVFTDEEQSTIRQSGTPNETLWTLWAAKEAAYKIISKLSSPPIFRHKSFRARVHKPSATAGNSSSRTTTVEVQYRKTSMMMQVCVGKDYIHATGAHPLSQEADDCRVISEMRACQAADWEAWEAKTDFPDGFTEAERTSISRAESALVRSFCKKSIAKALEISPARLQIIRPVKQTKTQPPFLLVDGQKTAIDITLSHHGRYLGWAFSMP